MSHEIGAHQVQAQQSATVSSSLTKAENVTAKIVSALTQFRKEQELQNVANYRMNSMSLMLSISNYTRSSRLGEEQEKIKQDLVKGFNMVKSMQENIKSQGDAMEQVQSNVKMQEDKVDDLNQRLDNMSLEYGKELEEHRRLLSDQRSELMKMTLSMFKQDATVDASILLIVWLLVNAPIVDWPLRLASAATASIPILPLKKNRRQIVVGQIARLFVFVIVSRALRMGAIHRGWHNCVGGPESYVMQALRYIQINFKKQKQSKEN